MWNQTGKRGGGSKRSGGTHIDTFFVPYGKLWVRSGGGKGGIEGHKGTRHLEGGHWHGTNEHRHVPFTLSHTHNDYVIAHRVH